MTEIKTLLDGVIEVGISNSKTLSVEDEWRGDATRDPVSLRKLRTEEIKAWADVEGKSKRRETDSRQREEEFAVKDADRTCEEENQARRPREQKTDRYVRMGVMAVELIPPLVLYGIWMKRGFRFEESGVYSSTTFRNLFGRFKPVK